MTPQSESEFRGLHRRADLVGGETSPKQEISRLALQASVTEDLLAETAARKLASVLRPVAVECFNHPFDRLTIKPMHGKLRANPDRAVTAAGANAKQACSESAVVLPSIAGQFFDGGLRVFCFDTACDQFAGEFFL